MYMLHCANRKTKGFVLIIVLVFMQIFAMLSLSILENHTLATKMSRAFHDKHLLFETAEKFLQSIENAISISYPYCEISVTEMSVLLMQSLDWWRESGCEEQGEKLKIYYVYEILQENILRITIQVIDLQNNAKEILQSTLVKIDNATHRKLWREL